MFRTVSLALGFAVTLAGPSHGQDLVLTNARILDPVHQTEHAGAIWITNGRIAGLGRDVPAEAPGQRIDLQGRWVIPGLIDLHTHSFGNTAPGGVQDGGGTARTATRVVRAGVVGLLDLFGAEDYLFSLRDRLRQTDTSSALLFVAGPCFTVPRGHCSEYGIPTRLLESPADVDRQMAELLPKRPDVIKVVYDHFQYGATAMPTMDRATLSALLHAASMNGIKTIVHVGTWQDVRDAVLAGASAVTHVARDGVVPDDVVALLASSRTIVIPTLTVHTELSEIFDHPDLADAPLLAAVASDSVRAVYRRGISHLDERTRSWIAIQRNARAGILESVRRLHAGGVRLLVGTDAGNWGIFQGYSVHRELVHLVEAGLSPWEALAAASTASGDFLGRKFGVVPGDEAHLVVLNASPLEDIRHTQEIEMVILRGRIVHRR